MLRPRLRCFARGRQPRSSPVRRISSAGSSGFDYFGDDEIDKASAPSSSVDRGRKQERSGSGVGRSCYAAETDAELSDSEFRRLLDGFDPKETIQARSRPQNLRRSPRAFRDDRDHRAEHLPRRGDLSIAKSQRADHVQLFSASGETARSTSEAEVMERMQATSDPEQALKLYREYVRTASKKPGESILCSALECATAVGLAEGVDSVVNDIWRFGVIVSARSYNKALHAYATLKELQRASDLLQDMRKEGGPATPTAESYWLCLQAAVGDRHEVTVSNQLLAEMARTGLQPPWTMWRLSLCGLLRRGVADASWRRLQEMRSDARFDASKLGCVLDASVCLAKMGRFDLVARLLPVLEGMAPSSSPSPSPAPIPMEALSAIVSAAVRHGQLETVEFCARLFRRTYAEERLPSEMICALANLRAGAGSMDAAMDVLFESDDGRSVPLRFLAGVTTALGRSKDARDNCVDYLIQCVRRHQKVPIVAINCVIFAAALAGDFESAWNLIADVKTVFGESPVCATYNAVLEGCLVHFHSDEARRALQAMAAAEVVGNARTCSLVVQVLAHATETENLSSVLTRATADGIKPSRKTFRTAALCCFQVGDGVSLKQVVEQAKRLGHPLSSILPELSPAQEPVQLPDTSVATTDGRVVSSESGS